MSTIMQAYSEEDSSSAIYHLNECTEKQRPTLNPYYYLTIAEHLVLGPGLSTLYAFSPLILTLSDFIEEKTKEQRC